MLERYLSDSLEARRSRRVISEAFFGHLRYSLLLGAMCAAALPMDQFSSYFSLLALGMSVGSAAVWRQISDEPPPLSTYQEMILEQDWKNYGTQVGPLQPYLPPCIKRQLLKKIRIELN